MLTDENIDVVHICTPHYLHKDMAVKALKAGKNIILEKPAAMTLEELSELEEAYKASDKKACIMLQNRTNNSVAQMKNLIDNDGTLGKMLGIAGFMTWHRDENYYKTEDWRGKWETEGGGLLINQAIHMIDLLDWLGGGIEEIKCSLSNFVNDAIAVEDTAHMTMKFKNGTTGVFYATNGFSTDAPFRIEIIFENGTLRYADSRLYRIDTEVEVVTTDSQNAKGKKCWGSGHKGVIEKFYYALENNLEDYLDLTEGVHSSKLMLSMYKESVEKGKEWIKI